MPARSGLLLVTIVFLFAAAAGIWGGSFLLAPTPEERRAELQRSVDATVLPPDYAHLPQTAVRTAGDKSLKAALADRWNVLFLGFTNCPDVCPLTLQNLATAKAEWTGSGSAPQVAFVSVDPRRDTAADADAYASSFDDAFIGATGDMPALRSLARTLRVDFNVPDAAADAQYSVQHPSQIFLIDPQGRLRAVFSPPFAPDDLAQDLQRIITGLEPAA